MSHLLHDKDFVSSVALVLILTLLGLIPRKYL
jgi:hypothetical protein